MISGSGSRLDRATALLRLGPDASGASLAEALWLAKVLPSYAEIEPEEAHNVPPVQTTDPNTVTPEEKTDEPVRQTKSTTEDEAHPTDERRGVYAPQTGRSEEAFLPATWITVPAADALPNRLAIERALKPFLKRFPSRRLKQLDTVKTADASADCGVVRKSGKVRKYWSAVTPILTPLPERWFDVLLLVERTDAMEVWADTVRELQILLGRHGAFRNVRVQRFAITCQNPDVVSLFTTSGQPQASRAAFDAEGRRLCLFLTNGTSPEWRRPPLLEFVRALGRRTTVAIVQMLPRELWSHTALGDAFERVHNLTPGAPNAALRVEDPFSGLAQRVENASCVPALTLEPQSVANWAGFVMSPRRDMTYAIQLMERDDAGAESRKDRSPAERLSDFRGTASREAFQLLRVLAGAPLTIPIMRLVQQCVSTSREQFHLAEVMLSGLIERITPADSTVPPDQVVYDFIPEVRELLLGTLSSRESESLDDAMQPAQEKLRLFVEGYTNRVVRDFRALLSDPEGLERLPESARSFVEVSRRIYEGRGLLPGKKPLERTEVEQLKAGDLSDLNQPVVPPAEFKAKVPRIVRLLADSPSSITLQMQATVRDALIAAGHSVPQETSADYDYTVLVSDHQPAHTSFPDALHMNDMAQLPRLLAELDLDPPGPLIGFPPLLQNSLPRPELEKSLAWFLTNEGFSEPQAAVVGEQNAGADVSLVRVILRDEVRRTFTGGIYWRTPLPTPSRGPMLLIETEITPSEAVPAGCARVRWIDGDRMTKEAGESFGAPSFRVGLPEQSEVDAYLKQAGMSMERMEVARGFHRDIPALVTFAAGAFKHGIELGGVKGLIAGAEIYFGCQQVFATLEGSRRRDLVHFAACLPGDLGLEITSPPPPHTVDLAWDLGLLLSSGDGELSLVSGALEMIRRTYHRELTAEHELLCSRYESREEAARPFHFGGVHHALFAGGSARLEAYLRHRHVLTNCLRFHQTDLLDAITSRTKENVFLRRLRDEITHAMKDSGTVPPSRIDALIGPSLQWPPSSGVPAARAAGTRGQGVRVVVAANGCNLAHPELRTSQTTLEASKVDPLLDLGTSLCSIVAGRHLGVAPSARLVHFNMLREGGWPTTYGLGEGLAAHLSDPPNIICIGTGLPTLRDLLRHGDDPQPFRARKGSRFHSVLQRLVERDVLVIAAIDLANPEAHSQPEAYPEVLFIGACNFDGTVLDAFAGSSKDLQTERAVPAMYGYGAGIAVASGREEYSFATGNGLAAAYVAGIAALYAQALGIGGEALRALLIRTADPQTRIARFSLTTVDAESALAL